MESAARDFQEFVDAQGDFRRMETFRMFESPHFGTFLINRAFRPNAQTGWLGVGGFNFEIPNCKTRLYSRKKDSKHPSRRAFKMLRFSKLH